MSLSALSQDREYTISGRVIDKDGAPVANVDVRAFRQVAGNGDDYIDSKVTTSNDGKFTYSLTASAGQQWSIVTDQTMPGATNQYFPIPAPFTALRRLQRNLKIRTVRLGTNKLVNVGDIPVNIWYGDVDVRILNHDKRALTAKEWKNLWFNVRDRNGNIIAGSSVGPELNDIVDLSLSQLKLVLPVGTWRLDIHKYNDATFTVSDESLGSTTLFEIRRPIPSLSLQLDLP